MPRRDGTGPTGQGPRTGWGAGNCVGGDKYIGRGFGRGLGRGLGIGRQIKQEILRNIDKIK